MLYEIKADKINKRNYINKLIIFKATAKLQLKLAYGYFAEMSTFGICSLLYNWCNQLEYENDFVDDPKELSEIMGYIYVDKPDPVMTFMRSPSNDISSD